MGDPNAGALRADTASGLPNPKLGGASGELLSRPASGRRSGDSSGEEKGAGEAKAVRIGVKGAPAARESNSIGAQSMGPSGAAESGGGCGRGGKHDGACDGGRGCGCAQGC